MIGGRAALLVRLALRPAVRLAAARVLAEAGTVDDAALLSDLVSVLRTTDEGHEERRALLDAMWTIAHRD